MFGEMKELAKLASLLKNGPAIQARIDELRTELSARTVTVEVGGGAVVVVADGKPRVRSVTVEPALLAALAAAADSDRGLAQDLIVQGVNGALEAAQRMMMERMAEAVSEMDLPMPKGLLEGILGSRSA